MEASIEGEDEHGCGLEIIDNNGFEHWIEIKYDKNEISYHEQDDYPDKAAERTSTETEHVNQARRFAKYYVYRKRGYDTLDTGRNPDRIAAVTTALGSLRPKTLVQSEYLGPYYQQLRHHMHGDEAVVDTEEIPAGALVRVEQDVAVELDDAATSALTEELAALGVMDALENTGADEVSDDLQEAIVETLAAHDIDTTAVGEALGTTLLSAFGPLEVFWRHAGQTKSKTATEMGTELADEDIDARMQMVAGLAKFSDAAGFKRALVHHLRCQIRDCYISMGIAPPEDVRILGPGFYKNMSWYTHLDFYPEYHDPDTKIEGWLEEHTPEEFLE